MIHRFIFHNDRVLPIEQVRLSPRQAGLLNGSLFTAVRVSEEVPFAFERHWKHLERDAARTRCPFPYKQDAVRAQLAEPALCCFSTYTTCTTYKTCTLRKGDEVFEDRVSGAELRPATQVFRHLVSFVPVFFALESSAPCDLRPAGNPC